jgi:hypothetical protein
MAMQELIAIENKPALVSVNFEELKASLEKELEKYDVVVTADTVADAKKLATELNATKKIIDDRRKTEVAKASEPVKAFDTEMKELVSMCSEGRKKILEQVQKFEDVTIEKVRKLLGETLTKLYADFKLQGEFQTVGYDDLIKITAMTAVGRLTKRAKDQLQMRVTERKSMQDQTERRLLELENQSYKAGLLAPLSRAHVETFLFANDEIYQDRLSKIIESELGRQKEAQEKMNQQMEEQRRSLNTFVKNTQYMDADSGGDPAATSAEYVNESQERSTSSTDKPMLRVSCWFDIPDKNIPYKALDAELRKMMIKAGIKTLSGVSISPLPKHLQDRK